MKSIILRLIKEDNSYYKIINNKLIQVLINTLYFDNLMYRINNINLIRKIKNKINVHKIKNVLPRNFYVEIPYTDEEYEKLKNYFNNNGLIWSSGVLFSDFNLWRKKATKSFHISNGTITYSNKDKKTLSYLDGNFYTINEFINYYDNIKKDIYNNINEYINNNENTR